MHVVNISHLLSFLLLNDSQYKIITDLSNVDQGASVTEWLRTLTSNHLPLNALGSSCARVFMLLNVRKLSDSCGTT
jgi:hypothetical protein